METNVIRDEEILRGLHEHSQIRQRVASLLCAVQDAGGDLKRADDAEQRLSEELRRLGQEAMQGWAERQVRTTEQELRRGGRAHREGKKNSIGTPPFGDISVMEPQYRSGSKRLRPFASSAGVSARGCSRLLQRVVTDFAADLPNAQGDGQAR